MQHHLEAVAMHATALVAGGHLRQHMRRLKHEPPPQVGVACTVDVHTTARRALQPQLAHPGQRGLLRDPVCEMGVGGVGKLVVEQSVVERRGARLDRAAQLLHFAAGKVAPSRRQAATRLHHEAVAMQPVLRVIAGRRSDLARRLEARGRTDEQLGFHQAMP